MHDNSGKNATKPLIWCIRRPVAASHNGFRWIWIISTYQPHFAFFFFIIIVNFDTCTKLTGKEGRRRLHTRQRSRDLWCTREGKLFFFLPWSAHDSVHFIASTCELTVRPQALKFICENCEYYIGVTVFTSRLASLFFLFFYFKLGRVYCDFSFFFLFFFLRNKAALSEVLPFITLDLLHQIVQFALCNGFQVMYIIANTH